MATQLGQARATTAAKYDAFVQTQLARVERRIRAFDIAVSLLGFAAITLVFAFFIPLADYFLELGTAPRLLLLVGYLGLAAAWLLFTLRGPLWGHVNPHFTARKVEELVPGTKNSVINWVDLHEQNLPGAIRGAVGQKAATDLQKADIDQAVSGKRAIWAGAVTGGLFLGLLLLLIWMRPGEFFHRLGRAFLPVTLAANAPRTQLTVLQPTEEEFVVPVGRAVTIRVQAEGKVPDLAAPDALTLHFRHDEDEVPQQKRLQYEGGSVWSASISALDVQQGFTWYVTGGDAKTDERRVRVRPNPLVTECRVTYTYRDYLAQKPETSRDRAIKAVRGTQVAVQAKTNLPVKSARVEFEYADGTRGTQDGQLVADVPESFAVNFVLDKSGRYRLLFSANDNEGYVDASWHPLVAVLDLPPQPVELTVPGRDIELPANGLLQLEGRAGDDFGVAGITLFMQVVGGPKLAAKEYGGADGLKLPDGGHPRQVQYKDFVDFTQMKTEAGAAFTPQAGTVIEYWIEARDACDYPLAGGNKAESKRFKVTVTQPDQDKTKQQAERDQANQDQQRHQQKQNDDFKKEAQKRKQEAEERQRAQQAEENGDKKPGDGANDPKREPTPEEKELAAKEQKLKDALDKKRQEEQERRDREESRKDTKKGEGKPEKTQSAEAKPTNPETQPGDKKENKNPDPQCSACESKHCKSGNSGGTNGQAEAKPEKQNDNTKPADSKGTGSDAPNRSGSQAGEAKDAGKPPEKGEGKPGGSQQSPGSKSDSKPTPAPGPQKENTPAETKPAPTGGNEATADKKPAEGKGETRPEEKGDSKSEGKPGPEGKTEHSAARQASGPGGGENKPSDAQDGKMSPRGDAKPDTKARKATPEDVQRLAEELKKNPEAFKDAVRELDSIQKVAQDKEARDQAREVLEKAGVQPGASESKRPPDPPKAGEDKKAPGEEKPSKDPPKDAASSKETKKGPDTPEQGEAKDQGDKKPPMNVNDPPRPEEKTADNKPRHGTMEDLVPRGDRTGSPPGGVVPPVVPGDDRFRDRAGSLSLSDLKNVDKKVLEEAKLTPEDLEKIRKAREEWEKNRQATDKPRDNVVGPSTGGNLPNVGSGNPTPGGTVKPGDLPGGGRPQPPPAYRDPVKEFNKLISNPDK